MNPARAAAALSLMLSCAGAPAETTPAKSTPPAEVEPIPHPSERTLSKAPTPCLRANTLPAERFLLSGNSGGVAASGLQIHYKGESWAHYEDGGFENYATMQFELGRESEGLLVSLLADSPYYPVLGHCVRLVELKDDVATFDVVTAADGAKLEPCPKDKPAAHAFLEAYADADEGTWFTATLEYDDSGHNWRIVPTPKITMHHATRVEWDNLAEIGPRGLGRARGQRVVATLLFGVTDVVNVGGRGQWRSTHHATIESACLAAE